MFLKTPSYGVYNLHLIHFARVRPNISDFKNRNQFLTAKLLKQGYKYHKLCTPFYQRYSIINYNVALKSLLQQGIAVSIL